MSFSIILDRPGVAYSPGSRISGQVVLEAKKDQAIDSVILTFTGRSKVHIAEHHQVHETRSVNGQTQTVTRTETRNYYSKGLFFSHSFNVMSGDPGQWGAGTYRWPFQVQIPLQAEEINEQQLKDHGAQIFTVEPPWKASYGQGFHELPDTFYYYRQGHYSSDVTASIRYKLTAQLTRPKDSYVMFSGNKDAECDVLVRSNNPPLAPNPRAVFPYRTHTATIKSLRLLPENQDGHLSLREKMHSLFHHSRLPVISLQVSVSTPDFVNIQGDPNQLLPFLIRITRIPTSPNTASKSDYKDDQIPTPEIILKRLRVRLVALTRVRTTGSNVWHREHSAPATSYMELYDAKMKNVPGRERMPIPTDGSWTDVGQNLGIVLGSITTRENAQSMAIVPDFSTFNIWRGYVFSWKMEISCCGGEEEIKWEADAGLGDGLQVRVSSGSEQMAHGSQIAQALLQAGYGGTQQGYIGQQAAYGGLPQQPSDSKMRPQPVLGAYGEPVVGGNCPSYQPPAAPQF